MVSRVVLSIVLLVVAAAGYAIHRRLRISRLARRSALDPVLKDIRRGIPTILYFTTPTCMTCRYAQEPAIEQLKEELGERVNVVKVDATEDVDAARRWKVRTVPATYVLDSSGKPVRANDGATDAGRLRAQLASLS